MVAMRWIHSNSSIGAVLFQHNKRYTILLAVYVHLSVQLILGRPVTQCHSTVPRKRSHIVETAVESCAGDSIRSGIIHAY